MWLSLNNWDRKQGNKIVFTKEWKAG